MRVVFDTNLFVSAFILPGRQCEHALLLAHRRKVDLYTYCSNPHRDRSGSSRVVRPTRKRHHGCAQDPRSGGNDRTAGAQITVLEAVPDHRILECAVTAEADLIVIGDQHLLKPRAFEGIPIVRLADFIRAVPSAEGAP